MKENYLQKNTVIKNHHISVIFLLVFARAFVRSVIKIPNSVIGRSGNEDVMNKIQSTKNKSK